MKPRKRNGFQILQIVLVVIALFNLIALFLFDYTLPSFSVFQPEENELTTQEPTETQSPYSIQFDSNTITYDGTKELDLLSGVSVVKNDGTILKSDVFAHIVTGETLHDKVITYSVDTDAGRITANRNLKLINYTGPSLVLPEELPKVSEALLDSILTYMPTDGSFIATDGFGNNITSAVTADYTIDPRDPSLVHYVFSIKNMFNDMASVAADIIIESNRPVLVLTQTAVTLPKGTSFQPLLYVENAKDSQGNSLLHRIHINGTVDVNTPGTYLLTYSVKDTNEETSLPQQLVVTVE